MKVFADLMNNCVISKYQPGASSLPFASYHESKVASVGDPIRLALDADRLDPDVSACRAAR